MKSDPASCKINSHGRFLSANKRFCRLFGFSDGEVEWHYLHDLFRYEREWDDFIRENSNPSEHFVVRLKNRKGRSFLAKVFRKASSFDGKTVYLNTFQKLPGESGISKRNASPAKV